MNAIITDRFEDLHESIVKAVDALQLDPSITANPFLLGDAVMRLNMELSRIVSLHPRYVAWADGHLDQRVCKFKVWICDSLVPEIVTDSFEFERGERPRCQQTILPVKETTIPPFSEDAETKHLKDSLVTESSLEQPYIPGHRNPRTKVTKRTTPKYLHSFKRKLEATTKKNRAIKFGQMMAKYTPWFYATRVYAVLGLRSFDYSVFKSLSAPGQIQNIKLALKDEYRDVVLPEDEYYNIDLSAFLVVDNAILAEKLIEFDTEESVVKFPKKMNGFHDMFIRRDNFTWQLSPLGKFMYRIFNGTEPEENYVCGLINGDTPVYGCTTKYESEPVVEEPVPAEEVILVPEVKEEIQVTEVKEPEPPVELEHICYFCKKWNGGHNRGNEKKIAAPCPVKGRKTLTDDTCGKFIQVISK